MLWFEGLTGGPAPQIGFLRVPLLSLLPYYQKGHSVLCRSVCPGKPNKNVLVCFVCELSNLYVVSALSTSISFFGSMWCVPYFCMLQIFLLYFLLFTTYYLYYNF